MDYQLYLPQEWFCESYSGLRKECHIPEELEFSTKNEIGLRLIRQAFQSGRFQAQWIGCDHAFVDSLGLLNEVWYFAATNSKAKVFLEFPEAAFPERKRGRPRKHPVLPHDLVSVQESAQNPDYPWETIVPAEGSKGPIYAERKFIRCFSFRKDQNRNYVKPGNEVWLYLRKYANGEVKYFTSNAPPHAVCDGRPFVYHTVRGSSKKSIPLTMPMAVKLIHEIVQNTAVNIKSIVCYHIRKNHCAYLSHRKTVILRNSL